MYRYGTILVVLILFFNQASYSQEPGLAIHTSQDTYHYGDLLTFTVKVTEVKGGPAVLYVIDELGKSSAAIPLAIEQRGTTLTSPFPFESQTYPEGRYTLRVQYAGEEASTEFFLRDSGRIVIPLWVKDVGRMWATGAISDETFSTAIGFLISSGIIVVPEADTTESSDVEVEIPSWVKDNARWWTQGLISDGDFAMGLQYLIKVGAIVR